MTEALVGKNVSLEESEKTESEIENKTEDEEDNIREVIRKRGPQKNISLFAFTATPKPKTLAVFGTPDIEGKPKPFHLYSMRQAIEESFILDVLKNYTTYESY
jgi:type I restriction enzyme R subunit